MNFDQYQQKAKAFADYPNIGNNVFYPVLGLSGESGEIANKVSKIIRDDLDIKDTKFKDEIKREMGDVLWFLSQIGIELNISLDDVAEYNLKKLRSRKKRGTLHGDGDNR